MIKEIINRIKVMLAKALIDSVDDSQEIQIIKIKGLAGEVQPEVERIQNYGFTSNPPAGSEVVRGNIGGNTDHAVAFAVDSGKHRKKNLKTGEVSLYDLTGSFIILREDGNMEIVTRDYILNQSGTIKLGSEVLLPTAGVVTGECLDPVTGVPFPDTSTKVLAQKV